MDRALYVAMTGAMQTQRAQASNAHNLANASTTGFKAELAAQVPIAIQGPGFASRVNSDLVSQGWDAAAGPLQNTGRDLDIALRDGSWLAVQATDGSEAYTRAGDLRVTAQGQLITASGAPVLGDGGPLSVPPNSSLAIGNDGIISVTPLGSAAAASVGRLRVVEASREQLERRSDGLMAARNGQPLNAAAGAVLVNGALEGSNVNLAEAMVNMIGLARSFELQVKLMRTAEENASASASLVKMS